MSTIYHIFTKILLTNIFDSLLLPSQRKVTFPLILSPLSISFQLVHSYFCYSLPSFTCLLFIWHTPCLLLVLLSLPCTSSNRSPLLLFLRGHLINTPSLSSLTILFQTPFTSSFIITIMSGPSAHSFKYNRLDVKDAAVLLVDHQSGTTSTLFSPLPTLIVSHLLFHTYLFTYIYISGLISLVQDYEPSAFRNSVKGLAAV